MKSLRLLYRPEEMIRITSLKGACATLTACFADLKIRSHVGRHRLPLRRSQHEDRVGRTLLGGASCRFDSSSACFETGQVAWPLGDGSPFGSGGLQWHLSMGG